MITNQFSGSFTILARNQWPPGSHITTQPTLILSLRSYPVLFIILSSGLCLSKVRVSLPRQTDRLQGRVSEEWRHKERGSPTGFELLLRETKRERRRVWKRERGSGCLCTLGAIAFFFYRLRPTDPTTGGRQPSTDRPSLTYRWAQNLSTHARTQTAASIHAFAKIKLC